MPVINMYLLFVSAGWKQLVSHIILIFSWSDMTCKAVSIPPNVYQVVKTGGKTHLNTVDKSFIDSTFIFHIC